MYCLHASLDGSLRPLKPGWMQVGQPFWLPLHLMQPNGPLATAFLLLGSVVLAFAWAAAGLFMLEGWAADGLFMTGFLVKFWNASCSYCSNVFLGWSCKNMAARKLWNPYPQTLLKTIHVMHELLSWDLWFHFLAFMCHHGIRCTAHGLWLTWSGLCF